MLSIDGIPSYCCQLNVPSVHLTCYNAGALSHHGLPCFFGVHRKLVMLISLRVTECTKWLQSCWQLSELMSRNFTCWTRWEREIVFSSISCILCPLCSVGTSVETHFCFFFLCFSVFCCFVLLWICSEICFLVIFACCFGLWNSFVRRTIFCTLYCCISR